MDYCHPAIPSAIIVVACTLLACGLFPTDPSSVYLSQLSRALHAPRLIYSLPLVRSFVVCTINTSSNQHVHFTGSLISFAIDEPRNDDGCMRLPIANCQYNMYVCTSSDRWTRLIARRFWAVDGQKLLGPSQARYKWARVALEALFPWLRQAGWACFPSRKNKDVQE